MKDPSIKHIRSKKKSFPMTIGNRGFTVAELVLALAIILVVISAMISLFSSLHKTYTAQNVAASVQHVARIGIDIMTRDIRMAGFNPLNINPIGIAEASPTKIRFQCDLNGSGAIETDTDRSEDIAYLLNDKNQLVRQKNGKPRSNRSLVDHVSELTFIYLDADDAQTSDLNSIRTVEISITVSEPAGRKRFLSRTYSTRILCRNLGLQL